MKRNKILIMLLISISLLIGSFMVFDYKNFKLENIYKDSGGFNLFGVNVLEELGVREDFNDFMDVEDYSDLEEIMENKENIISTERLDDLKSLDIGLTNSNLIIVKGNINEVILYKKEKDKINNNSLKIEKNSTNYSIKAKNDKKARIIIKLKNPELTEIKCNNVNGILFSKEKFKSLIMKSTNGVISLEGEGTYPMKVKNVNGIINLNFDKYNAEIFINKSNGVLNLFDENEFSLGKNKTIRKVFGSAEDKIELKTTNGIININ